MCQCVFAAQSLCFSLIITNKTHKKHLKIFQLIKNWTISEHHALSDYFLNHNMKMISAYLRRQSSECCMYVASSLSYLWLWEAELVSAFRRVIFLVVWTDLFHNRSSSRQSTLLLTKHVWVQSTGSKSNEPRYDWHLWHFCYRAAEVESTGRFDRTMRQQ